MRLLFALLVGVCGLLSVASAEESDGAAQGPASDHTATNTMNGALLAQAAPSTAAPTGRTDRALTSPPRYLDNLTINPAYF